jgi:hypothetical protein
MIGLLTLEDGNDMLSRNLGDQLSTKQAQTSVKTAAGYNYTTAEVRNLAHLLHTAAGLVILPRRLFRVRPVLHTKFGPTFATSCAVTPPTMCNS